MDCYDAKWCPDRECDLCDFWLTNHVGGWEERWLRFRRFFVRLARWDWRAGYVNLAPPPPIYATHEDALRDVMRSGRAAVFEKEDAGGYAKTWEAAPSPGAPGSDEGAKP
jgi:hypothetical protein